MKIITVFCAFLGLVARSNGYSTTLASQQERIVEEKNPSRFYFGPEVFGYQLKTHIQGIKINGTRLFSGIGLGYEYLRPDYFYGCINLLGAFSTSDFKASKEGHSLYWHKADRMFSNLEVRLGYTFAPENWTTSPFLGIGVYNVNSLDHHNHQGFKQTLPYTAIGVRSKYTCNPDFDLGVNVKVFHTMDATHHFRYDGGRVKDHHNMWGGEVGLPFTWNIGMYNRWNAQLEPYYLMLNFKEAQHVYGARLLFGYRF